MQESFLHFLWGSRRFLAQDLCTTDYQFIEIHQVGEHNRNAGPDFFNARVSLEDTLWAGNIEIHIRASEWLLHGHQHDPAYENVVLHVVYEEDTPIFRSNGTRIPCLELKGRVPREIWENYHLLAQSSAWIPCETFWPKVPDIIRLNWLDRVLIERMEQKTDLVQQMLVQTGNHWEEAFYRLLARNFGLKVNAEPFESLARSLPLGVLAKHKTSLPQIEALFLGQAGLLEGPYAESWPSLLLREYRHLAHKYALQPLPPGQWKFLRMRPASFPTVRLAQFAALVHQSVHLFSKVLEINNLRELENLFALQPSAYWTNHFILDKPSVKREKGLSREFIHLLIINTIVPFLFHYGRTRDLPVPKKRALELLEAIPAESNTIVEAWSKLGVTARHAYQTQALLQLKTHYCDQKRCLDCAIGCSILK